MAMIIIKQTYNFESYVHVTWVFLIPSNLAFLRGVGQVLLLHRQEVQRVEHHHHHRDLLLAFSCRQRRAKGFLFDLIISVMQSITFLLFAMHLHAHRPTTSDISSNCVGVNAAWSLFGLVLPSCTASGRRFFLTAVRIDR